jgi:hypothetical protein
MVHLNTIPELTATFRATARKYKCSGENTLLTRVIVDFTGTPINDARATSISSSSSGRPARASPYRLHTHVKLRQRSPRY